MNQWEFDL